eukprot:COSAG06_NODE_11362_length_1521_cov_450.343882_1_plen_153_part_00
MKRRLHSASALPCVRRLAIGLTADNSEAVAACKERQGGRCVWCVGGCIQSLCINLIVCHHMLLRVAREQQVHADEDDYGHHSLRTLASRHLEERYVAESPGRPLCPPTLSALLRPGLAGCCLALQVRSRKCVAAPAVRSNDERSRRGAMSVV